MKQNHDVSVQTESTILHRQMYLSEPFQQFVAAPVNLETFVVQPMEQNHNVSVQTDPTDLHQPMYLPEQLQHGVNEDLLPENRNVDQPINIQQAQQNMILLTKKEDQIKLFKETIRKLIERIGAEDLTVEMMKEYGEILLSSPEKSNGSEDSDEDEIPAAQVNQENVEPNIQYGKQIDMPFSFAHEFVLNVRRNYPFFIFTNFFRSIGPKSTRISRSSRRI